MLRNLVNQSVIKIMKFYHKFQVHPKKIEIKDKKFLILPDIFAPINAFVSSQFLIENLLVNEGDVVLDLGTGTGILAIFCADKAEKVIATDINPKAVELAKNNVKLNKKTNVEVRWGDLFEPINEKFDLILFNPPYIPENYNPNDNIEVALCCGKKYEIIHKFAREAKKYLKPKGKIQIIFSNLADSKVIKLIFIRQGYEIKMIAERGLRIEKFMIYLLSHDGQKKEEIERN